MSLSTEIANTIARLLVTTVRDKLRGYEPETVHMPFHHLLLGRDRYAMFSFIHSINTTFGMSIWEQVAVLLAEGAGNYAKRQYRLLGEIDQETEQLIRVIHSDLRSGKSTANKAAETKQIRDVIRNGQGIKHPDSIVDLFMKDPYSENYFDITSAKPNMKEFVALKLKLLNWIALRLSRDKNVTVFTRLAIPYNPYHPEPYERWTLRGLYDLGKGEVLVGEEFWNFVANDKIYEDLLDVFREAGEELRNEIDEKFAKFTR